MHQSALCVSILIAPLKQNGVYKIFNSIGIAMNDDTIAGLVGISPLYIYVLSNFHFGASNTDEMLINLPWPQEDTHLRWIPCLESTRETRVDTLHVNTMNVLQRASMTSNDVYIFRNYVSIWNSCYHFYELEYGMLLWPSVDVQ